MQLVSWIFSDYDKELHITISHVERYFWTLVNQPNFSKVMGEVKQAESVPPVSSAKKPAQAAQAKESMPKEAKKEVKKEPAKEEEEAPKPKPKNSLDLLPPSKMILDEWKRLYSNTKTNFREVAIKENIQPSSLIDTTEVNGSSAILN
ncbi:uncharacterized protein A4U43_C04F31300 [Asparagus officinalis]|uniref:EF-1-gamma C-terminal domain-containing protein n=1 Tax=Asparagus officinalis TaxID=4686 RepID=A0A5P1F9I5_ASPOF|nr:uncharacterized protein A4U43_C04F31300 [Asparagus officinalis]